MTTNIKTRRRGGFTLVELLVVIAIIAVLAALSGAGIYLWVGSRYQHNTEETIKTVFKLLQTRQKAVIDSAKTEVDIPPAVVALAGGDMARARVIWIKVRLAEAFPQSYAEVNTTPSIVSRYIPAGRSKSHWAKYQATIGATPGGPGQSSACLLMALKTLGSDGGVAVQDQLAFAVNDSDGDGVPELVDAWGKPLIFFRFPPVSPALQAANPAASGSVAFKHSDPTDPTGLLLNGVPGAGPGWYNTLSGFPPPVNTLGKKFEAEFHVIRRDPVNAAYVTPVVQSLGKDGVPSADDIFSFNLKLE